MNLWASGLDYLWKTCHVLGTCMWLKNLPGRSHLWLVQLKAVGVFVVCISTDFNTCDFFFPESLPLLLETKKESACPYAIDSCSVTGHMSLRLLGARKTWTNCGWYSISHFCSYLCAQVELKMLIFIRDEVNQFSIMIFRCGGCALVSCCHWIAYFPW